VRCFRCSAPLSLLCELSGGTDPGVTEAEVLLRG